jgi:Magnesium chelatase, subunit ChlI
MLARRRTTILPAMPLPEALDTTRIHRVAGRTGERTAWVTTRPCRAPHHTISDVGLIGGGPVPMPGEVSLAHHGVRFLDELPACRPSALKVLRKLIEKSITEKQSPERSGSQRLRGLAGTASDLRELERGPVAANRHCRGHDTQDSTAFLRRSGVWSRLLLFA